MKFKLLSELLKPNASAKIYITQKDNDYYFGQKLPTYRNGFCYITRKIEFISDPDEIYADGEYGIIKAGDKKLIVTGDPKSGMEISGVQ